MSKVFGYIWLSSLLALLLPFAGLAAVRTVPDDYATIQAAIDAASANDEIIVRAGLYNENLDTKGKQLVLRGESGASSTTVDGGRRSSVLFISGGGVVQGLTFRNGHALGGGGIHVQGDRATTIRACVVEDNVAGFGLDSGVGGGILVNIGTNVLIQGNAIRNNYAGTSGGGIYDASSSSEFIDNVISENGCHVCGGGIRAQSRRVSGNLIVRNWTNHAGGGICGAAAMMERNTVVYNYTTSTTPEAAGIHIEPHQGTIRNNIVAFNHGPAGAASGVGVVCSGDLEAPLIECNDLWQNDGGNWEIVTAPFQCDTLRNISGDPLFCGPDDFRISELSPCTADASPCGSIGALGVGCQITPSTRRSWGEIKLRYR